MAPFLCLVLTSATVESLHSRFRSALAIGALHAGAIAATAFLVSLPDRDTVLAPGARWLFAGGAPFVAALVGGVVWAIAIARWMAPNAPSIGAAALSGLRVAGWSGGALQGLVLWGQFPPLDISGVAVTALWLAVAIFVLGSLASRSLAFFFPSTTRTGLGAPALATAAGGLIVGITSLLDANLPHSIPVYRYHGW